MSEQIDDWQVLFGKLPRVCASGRALDRYRRARWLLTYPQCVARHRLAPPPPPSPVMTTGLGL